MAEMADKLPEPEMHRREITMSDGRYLIFFTFGDEGETTGPQSKGDESSEE